MAMTKVKNLQLWCKKMADGYRDVEVRDMAASWKSGLAFCAIIHRFRPDLIDYDSLSKENVFENNQLAFEVAEKQLNIPAFLEAADMVAIRVPDKLSVVTYVSQYYNYFHDKPQLGGPGVKKCTTPSKKKDTGTLESKSLTPSQNSSGNQQKNRQQSIGDKCSLCHEKVYLLERHIENGKLYHRSCFRKSDLSPTSKVFKRQPYNAIDEDKETFSATKLRKIEDKKDVSKQSEPDFWQRRAEAKAKKEVNDSNVLKKVDTKHKPDEGSDIPSLKKDKNVKSDIFVSKVGDNKSDIHGNSRVAQNDKPLISIKDSPVIDISTKKQTNAGDLINKFKQLDERNLKHENRNFNSESGDNKPPWGEFSKIDFPKPTPRQSVSTLQVKMDTSETPSIHSQPRPSPRGQKLKEIHTDKSDHKKSAFKTKSQERPKTEISRPKTPPIPGKSEFKLNISSVSSNKSEQRSPSSPPPLPSSSPPKLTATEPPKILDSNKSPKPSPRFGKKAPSPGFSPRNINVNSTESRATNLKNTNVPSKTERSASPMDTSESLKPSKAIVHEPSDSKAVLVVPKKSNDEKQNREVLGGLLKSLANVRTKHDVANDDKSGLTMNIEPSKQAKGAERPESVAPIKGLSKEKVPKRPKSSFVSQNSQLFGDKENSSNTKAKGTVTTKKTTVTTTVVTKQTDHNQKAKINVTNTTDKIQVTNNDSIPEWKRQLDKRKQEKARPKSADLLNDTTIHNHDSSGMLDWQKEAEKRKQARQGGYVDPEKSYQTKGNSDLNSRISRPLSPQRKSEDKADKYVPPSKNDINNSKSPERNKPNTDKESIGAGNEKKKIGLGQKFVFEEPTDVAPPPPKPPRRPDAPPNVPKSPTSPNVPKSPTSPKSSLPRRPPPPRTDSMMSRTKHHITPYKIQQELKLIDSKLTQLELKGRSLEDSIRKASDDEEDDLMISWFQLVNEKNELVRKECDYIYLSRQQVLEVQQEEIDKKLRKLLEKPEDQKSEADIQEEEYLTEKLLDVVNQRNNIVDSIDEDRLRYLEEDRDIEMMLQQKAFKAIPDKPKKGKKKSRGLGFLRDSKELEVKMKKDKIK